MQITKAITLRDRVANVGNEPIWNEQTIKKYLRNELEETNEHQLKLSRCHLFEIPLVLY